MVKRSGQGQPRAHSRLHNGSPPACQAAHSPDAARIRLLMKRHKEPAPATPAAPAPPARAPRLARPRGLCARSPTLAATRRAPGPQKPRPSGVPREPRLGTRGRARAAPPTRAHAPLSGRAPGPRRAPPLAPGRRSPHVPASGPWSAAPGLRRTRPPCPPAAGPARLPAQRAQSAAHRRPPRAILEACDVSSTRSPLTHI